MAEVVFVLGAGASMDTGAPMMADFLDKAEELLRSGQVGSDDEHFRLVYKAIAELRHAQAGFVVDRENLESVFSALDMARLTGGFGSLNHGEVLKARTALVHLIARTLDESIKFEIDGNGKPKATDSYAAFVQNLKVLIRGTDWKYSKGTPAVITLNYDLALDVALWRGGVEFNYSLRAPPSEEARDPTRVDGPVPYLKLHGSLNWTKCRSESCSDRLKVTDLRGAYENQRDRRTIVRFKEIDGPLFESLNVGQWIEGKPHDPPACILSMHGPPLIVPPTWSKTEESLVANVWRHAASELREARYVVFAGFSFPPNDTHFRYLLSLAMAGSARLRKVLVVDPYPHGTERLREWATENLRPKIEHVQGTFAEANRHLPRVFELGAKAFPHSIERAAMGRR